MTLQVRTARHQPMSVAFSVSLSAILLLGVFPGASGVQASDWDRFRGPNGTGISPDPDPLPTTFSETENLQWKVALPGAGVSCPTDARAKTDGIDHIVGGHTNRFVDDEHTGDCVFKILVIHEIPPIP